jgi:hypothetical protein
MPLFPFPPPCIPPSWHSTKAQRSKLRAAQTRALKPPPACLDDPRMLKLWHKMTADLGLTEASLIDAEHDPWPPIGCGSVHLYAASEFLHAKTALGLAGDRTLWHVALLNPHGWIGYCFEVIGVLETPEDPADAPRFYLDSRANAPKAPRRDHVIRGDHLGYSEPLALIACYTRVCYRAQAPWIERTWHAETGEIHEHMLYREQASRDLITKVEKARQLLRRLVSTGRRRGTWLVAGVEMTREQLIKRVKDIMKPLHDKGLTPTQEFVAEKLGIRDSQLRLYLSPKRYDLPWEQLLEDR